MKDWNVVVTLHEGGFKRAMVLLRELGPASPSEYHNVVTMKVDDLETLLEALRQKTQEDATILESEISRVVAGEQCFGFQSPDEFEAKAKAAALSLVPALAGKAFHVRLHRRGFKGQLSSPEEERFLDHVLLEALDAGGTPGSISFDDPDAILVVETISNHACVSLWSRDDIKRYPFLRLD
jgi:tRNA(Ser,Leu) C12 N-acetylase TAN1